MAHLLNTRLDLLNVVARVVALSDDNVEVCLALQMPVSLNPSRSQQCQRAALPVWFSSVVGAFHRPGSIVPACDFGYAYMLLRVFYSRLKDVLRLFHELPVQIDCIRVYSALGIVLAKDVVGCLLVVLIDHSSMALPLLAECMRSRPVAAFICLVSAVEA